MRRVVSVDMWGAALLAVLGLAGCGGNVRTAGTGGSGGSSGSSGSGGSGGGSGGSGGSTFLKFPCKNPKPVIVGGVDTGYDNCDGGFMRRRKVVDCPSLLPRNSVCAGADAGMGSSNCTTDSDCTDQPNGYCDPSGPGGAPGCYCRYGCRTDADCGSGSICVCADPVGYCAQSTCKSDSSCSGYLCSSYVANPGCGGTAFACQTAGDSCAGDSDCPSGYQCSYDGAHHACVQIGCAIGRPFLVEGIERLAATAERGDWADALRPRLDGLGPEERAELAQRWTQIALMEHASVAAFARFALQLLSLGAPADLLERTHAAMADETRHARLGFALASAYSGRSVGPAALPVDGALGDNSPRGIIATLVREGCIGETVAALEAAEAREHAADPVVRAVLEQIAADETRHAELAWRTLSWALDSGDAELARAVRAELRAALGEPAPATEPGGHMDEDALLGHGLVAGALRTELRRDALDRAVRPCALALLASHDEQELAPVALAV